MIELSMIKLLNLIVKIGEGERTIINNSEEFKNIRESIKADGDYINLSDKESNIKQLKTVITCACNYWLDYLVNVNYTNVGMSNFIRNYITGDRVRDPVYIASAISALGNADGFYDVKDGLDLFKEAIETLEAEYLKDIDNEDITYTQLNLKADKLFSYGIIAQALCTFMIAKYGSCKGIGEHFGQNVKDTNVDVSESAEDVTDSFEEPNEVTGTEGLLIDHYPLILSGLEQFLTADKIPPIEEQTFEQRFVMGVMVSRNIVPHYVGGMEGAVWDKIKDGFTKAYQMIKDGLQAIKENYFDKSLEELSADITKAADENKKALQDVSEKDARLADKLKPSIERLAEGTGLDEVKTAMASLSDVNSGASVIDKLMVTFTKVYGETADLQKSFDQINSTVSELESQSNSTVNDDDKEAIKTKKAAISDKTGEAKSGLSELQTKLRTQRKQLDAIGKAIKGITPAIFVKQDQNKDNQDKGEKK